MKLPFDSERALQAAAHLLKLDGGSMDIRRLTALLYVAEREWLTHRGDPIAGGAYLATEDGPVHGTVLAMLMGQEIVIRRLPRRIAKKRRPDELREWAP